MGGRGCHCRWAKLGRVIVTSLLLDRIREKKEKVLLASDGALASIRWGCRRTRLGYRRCARLRVEEATVEMSLGEARGHSRHVFRRD